MYVCMCVCLCAHVHVCVCVCVCVCACVQRPRRHTNTSREAEGQKGRKHHHDVLSPFILSCNTHVRTVHQHLNVFTSMCLRVRVRMGTRLPPPNGPVAPNRARRAPSARCLCLKHHDRLQQQCTTAASVDGMTGVDAMTAHHRFSGPLTHVDTREQQTFPDHLNTAARYAGRRPELVDASPRTLLIFVSERTNKRHHLNHSVR